MMMNTQKNWFPFSASQWQELEHQALIFKYMISGMPIPADLLLAIDRSLDSSLSSKLILHQPQQIGWNCFQMGLGRKIDPEPGRCRRTDGKKWRCSKEAYPDSKYCERHMHRGRNRSRKPVEVLTASTTTTTNTSIKPTPISSITHSNPTSHSLSFLSSVASESHHHRNPSCNTHLHHPFLYPQSSSSKPPGIGSSSQENITHHFLEAGPYSLASKDCSENGYGHGMKEEVDGHAFFSDASGTMRSISGSSMDDFWQLAPLTMASSVAHLKQRTCSGLQSEYPFLQLQGLGDTPKQQMPLNIENDDEPQKVMHHFFDEWPPQSKDSWRDSGDKLPNSTTQLSISMPNSSHDFFISRNDK